MIEFHLQTRLHKRLTKTKMEPEVPNMPTDDAAAPAEAPVETPSEAAPEAPAEGSEAPSTEEAPAAEESAM